MKLPGSDNSSRPSMTSNMTSSLSGHLFNGLRFCRSRKCVFIILCCLLGIFKLVYQFTPTQFRYTISLGSYTLPCEMPMLDPFDPKQMKNVRKVDPIKCHERHNPVFVDDKNIVQFNKTVLGYLELKSSQIKCICQKIVRANYSDNDVNLSEELTCTPPYNVSSDFFKIKCRTSDNKVIVDTILTKVFRTSWDFRSVRDDFYNVILFGIDSVSRNDAQRQIPFTVKYLKELGAIEMLLHNRIGGHSFDNILPLITGHFANHVDIPYYDVVGERFEHFPFIWKNMSENYYATFHAEDVLGFNTFNFQKEGFSTQPTTHYMRPFWQMDYDSRPNTLFWKESTTSYNKRRCLVNKPKYLIQIEYLKQFIHTYRDVRKFAMSHINDLAHEDVNELHQAEGHLLDFLKWLKSSDNLENTFLIVYSDHGPRGQSSTHQSTMETNLPFLCIVPPKNLTKKYPDVITNLQRNAQLLTTHFDLYATLRDIVLRNYGTPSVYYVNDRPRGISLFRNIGKQRSCQGLYPKPEVSWPTTLVHERKMHADKIY
ncbi:hypothetical protein ACF0H5_021564 [Mactra antiquata]